MQQPSFQQVKSRVIPVRKVPPTCGHIIYPNHVIILQTSKLEVIYEHEPTI